jgi:LPS export ABC transporter protein LptC
VNPEPPRGIVRPVIVRPAIVRPAIGRPAIVRPAIAHLIALVLVGILLAGCEEKARPPVIRLQQGKQIPDQESWDATITFTDSGRVTGVLRAGYIGKFIQDRYTLLDSGVVVDFYNDARQHTSVLNARRGKVNDTNNDFEARGDVVVRSDSGAVLRTEELFWDNRRGKVTTEAYVEITTPTEEIHGIGLESDASLTNYTIHKVTGKSGQK